jgi:hypothetical protein
MTQKGPWAFKRIDVGAKVLVLGAGEFVPVVLLDSSRFTTDRIATIIKQAEPFQLSEKIADDRRQIDLFSIVTSPGELTIPFVIEKGSGSSDGDGYLTAVIDASVSNVSVSPDKAFEASLGNRFELELTISKNTERRFFVDFYASDDDADDPQCKAVLCGRVEVQVFPDVFTQYERNQLVDEMTFIGPFAIAHAPEEYSDNYCLYAADRGLSKLLDNTVDFYAVDRSHTRLSSRALTKGQASRRGAKLRRSGFVYSDFTFDRYRRNDEIMKKVKNVNDYGVYRYAVITLRPGSELMHYLQKSIERKHGFHVYYLSLTDGFHTLLLVIDNRDPRNETYAIYDQEGITSSSGRFDCIDDGFAKQTSWTLLNFYLNKGFPCAVTTQIWKIQRQLR